MVERALSDNAVQAGPFWSGWNAVLSDILGSYAFSVHCGESANVAKLKSIRFTCVGRGQCCV